METTFPEFKPMTVPVSGIFTVDQTKTLEPMVPRKEEPDDIDERIFKDVHKAPIKITKRMRKSHYDDDDARLALFYKKEYENILKTLKRDPIFNATFKFMGMIGLTRIEQIMDIPLTWDFPVQGLLYPTIINGNFIQNTQPKTEYYNILALRSNVYETVNPKEIIYKTSITTTFDQTFLELKKNSRLFKAIPHQFVSYTSIFEHNNNDITIAFLAIAASVHQLNNFSNSIKQTYTKNYQRFKTQLAVNIINFIKIASS